MAKLLDDGPDVKCSTCGIVFTVIWNRKIESVYRSVVFDKIEYCPFCGDEFESVESTP